MHTLSIVEQWMKIVINELKVVNNSYEILCI